MNDPKIKINKPHAPHGPHVDVITPLKDIPGADKMRIGPDGKIISEEIIIKGGDKIKIK